jgi:hypothetical protein
MAACLVFSGGAWAEMPGIDTPPGCFAVNGYWSLPATEYASSDAFPLTPAQIVDAWGFGFFIGAVPMAMALGVFMLVQFIRRG